MTIPESDTRWTAILSIDMVGFTDMSQRFDHEQVFDILSVSLGLATKVIRAHGGHVIDTAGDGILAGFGAPRALEDAALRACLAADEFRGRIKSKNTDLVARFGESPKFRYGLAGGPAMVVRQGADSIKVVGEPVNLASRLQALAEPDTILMSDSIRREAEGLIRVSDGGTVEIKGYSDPVRFYRLDGATRAKVRFDGAIKRGIVGFVSREDEMRQALVALSGPACFVVLSGAAGLGKSRLAHEITARMSSSRPIYVGQCDAMRSTTPFGPVLDMLQQASGDASARGRGDILSALAKRFPDLCQKDDLKAFIAPRDESGDHKGRVLRDRAFLLDVLRRLSARENGVYVLEDAHWADGATRALLAVFSQKPDHMIITAREDFAPNWLAHPLHCHIHLVPLAKAHIGQIAEAVIGEKIAPEVTGLITRKSEGNPLVAEELARALNRGGHLIPGDQGLALASANAAPLSGNLEHLVLSRVDLLPADQRAALQVAATIGRSFPQPLLQSISGDQVDLNEIAAGSPGLIEPLSRGRWRFSHALIRDAIYGSLLKTRRQKIHGQISEALELCETAGPEDLNRLAMHFVQADIPSRAVPYLVRVARQSLKDYALDHVDYVLEQAMTYIDAQPDLIDADAFGELAITWLRALEMTGDFRRLHTVSDRILPRLERAGYSADFSIARTLTAIAKTHLRDYAGAEELAQSALQDARMHSDDWGVAWAQVALMRTYEETGWQSPEVIADLAQQIAPVAEARRDNHMAMTALYLLSSCHRSCGRRLKALAIADQIKEFSRAHNDRRALSYAHWVRALVYSVEGNPERAYETNLKALKDAIPGSADEKVSRAIMAFAEIFLHPPDQVRPTVLAIQAEALDCGDYNLAHSMQWTHAALELRAGHLALGWRLLNKFIPVARDAGNRSLLRQGYLLRSEILLTLLRLIDPDAEAPSGRPKPKRGRPGVRDIVTFLWLRLNGRRMATEALKRIIDLDPEKRGAAYARARIGLGLIAASQGKKQTAIQHLHSGLENARAEKLEILIRRAEAALSRLGDTGPG